MANHKLTTNLSLEEARYRVAHLFRDRVLRALFSASERDLGAAPALVDRPRILTGGAAARVVELVG